MNRKKVVIGAVLLIVGLPMALVLIAVAHSTPLSTSRIGPTARSSPRARSGSTCSTSRRATTQPSRRRS